MSCLEELENCEDFDAAVAMPGDFWTILIRRYEKTPENREDLNALVKQYKKPPDNRFKGPSYFYIVEPMLQVGLKNLLEEYPDFNPEGSHCDTSGIPYLGWACYKSHTHVVVELLQCGASFMNDDIPLHHACMLPWISEGPKLDKIRKDKVVFLKWLLSEYEDARTTINWSNKAGLTPLHLATMDNATAMMKVLLIHGSDILRENNYGETPICLAGRFKSRESAQELLHIAHGRLEAMSEWRPTNHHNKPIYYRTTMVTLLLLAKAY